MPRNIKVSRLSNTGSTNVAWLYAAVSSDKQSETLVHQRAWAEGVCAQKGWDLAHVTDPDESVNTGKKGVRSHLLSLLARIEQLPPERRPEWLLMLRLDRVGRGSIVDSQVVVRKFKELGVRIWTRFPEGEVKNDSAMEELMVAFAAALARMENDIKREKSTNAHARIKRAGLHYGHAPYGTVLIDRRPVAYAPEAAIVHEIFERRLKGWGVHRLAKWAARTAPPKRKTDGSFRTMKWATGTIESMLACATYRGGIIDAATFDAVQGMRKPARRREAIHPWPLRGAVRCTCGYLLTGSHGGSGKDRRRYYLCKNVAKHDSYPLHRAEALEAQFQDYLQGLLASPERLDAYRTKPSDAEPFHERVRSLERHRAALEKRKSAAWDIAEAGNLAPAQLRERLEKIEKEIAQTDAALSAAQSEIADIGHSVRLAASAREALAVIAECWPDGDLESQQEMAAAVAAAVGGFWVAPNEQGSAGRPVLRTGLELHPASRFSYSENCTLIRNYANRAVATSPGPR